MANIDPGDVPLPAFLDPVLSYLASVLPDAVYLYFLSFLAHSLALLASLFNLAIALSQSKPWEWDPQQVLPPLITLLAAYLALRTAYRTTTWMVRTSVFFIKWGAFLSALAAGAGWFMGNQAAGHGNGVRGGGMMPMITGLVLDLFNGQGQDAAGGSRTRSSRPTSKGKSRSTKPRPKSWESFERHREWQFEESKNNADGSATEEVQRFVANVMGKVREGGWWEAAKGVAGGFGDGEGRAEEASEERKQPPRKAKGKAKTGKGPGSR